MRVRSEWVDGDTLALVLAAMMPGNALAVECSLVTGLRIDDVLSLHTDTVRRTARPYVRDSKTGKSHRIYLPRQLRERMLAQAGRVYVWEHRTDWTRHRTRQAVYKDMRHAAAVWERNGRLGAHVSPHSARKCAAVRAYKRGGLDAAAELLNHDPGHPLVTMLYALADQVGAAGASARHRGARRARPTKDTTGTPGRLGRRRRGHTGGNRGRGRVSQP